MTGERTTGHELVRIDDLRLLPQTRDFFELKSSRAVPVFLFMVALAFASFLLWATFARMDDVVKAPAVIRPSETISALKCLSSGRITGKHYMQNQRVSRGDLLLSVDNSSELTELENVSSQLGKIAEELEINNVLLSSMESGNNEADKGSPAYARTASFFDEYGRQQNEIARLQRNYADERDMPKSLRVPKRIAECRSKLEQAQLAFDTWHNDRLVEAREKDNALKEQRRSLETRKAVLERTIRDSSLYAPIDGIVEECTALNEGDYVLSGSDIVKIVPAGNGFLKARLTVDASHIARIKLGQQAKLRFPGLPPSSFGQLTSSISLIPADMTMTDTMPVFEVEADIEEPLLTSASGERILLRPGVSAEARIVIAHDTVLKMILRKLDFLQ